ncbi:FAD-binding oxidoreductase [Winogradskyella aquimaris]|uniref:FAD-binding oxidoreductase n=1 Tax=Winogradskyella aquimaris TaxID=864074 RepID=A0ABU5EPA5_9FLAO|nr:FAD-binding oxidoreductase [Winogradskyella aquimaris]MDY2586589.1 FAD-binding oxidoreductase [Winogradskyella aquimaris]
MEYKITIQRIEHVNYNVVRLRTDKPKNYKFTPGQATELSIDKEHLKDEKRPFTFTSLPEEDTLEFTIKIYPSHNGVTEQLEQLKVGDTLLIGEAWGAINYKGEGTFIAGGAGITPFIAILKHLNDNGQLGNNQLFYSNRQEKDIIYKNNLEAWLGKHLHLALSEENKDDYHNGHIDANYLKKHHLDVSKPVYVCGPPAMEQAITADLIKLGVSDQLIIKEA